MTMPLGKDARFNLPPTETIRTSPPPTRGRPLSSGAGPRSGSSHSSKRLQTNRQSLQRRRSEQISALLDEARKLFELGDLEKARDKCDEALMFDFATARDHEAERMIRSQKTADHREAVQAFIDKRKPLFAGK